MPVYQIASVVAAPTLLSVLFFILIKKTKFGSFKNWQRQIIIGIAFGLLSCLSILIEIPYNGYTIGVFTAVPLTSGLFFGGPAGVITGIIGALFRWFTANSGLAEYTKIASSAAILLAGLFAIPSKLIFDELKKLSLIYGSLAAAFTEVFYMLLIFLTHFGDIKTAFDLIKSIAVIDIAISIASILLTTTVYFILFRKKRKETSGTKKIKSRWRVAQVFAVILVICVLAALFVTEAFTSALQNRLSDLEVENLLKKNVNDVVSELNILVERDLSNSVKLVAANLDKYAGSGRILVIDGRHIVSDNKSEKIDFEITAGRAQMLYSYAKSYNVSKVYVADKDGIILMSDSYPELEKGFDLASNKSTAGLLSLLKETDTEEYITAVASGWVSFTASDGTSIPYLFVGSSLKLINGIAIAAFNEARYNEIFESVVSESVKNRHIGQNGFMYVLNAETGELISSTEGYISNEDAQKNYFKINKSVSGKVLSYTDVDGIDYYYLLSEMNGYFFIGCIPVSEATFSRDISIYISLFMLVSVFFLLFTVVFLLIKTLIVNNIHKVNSSLEKITAGDLSTQVDIRGNEEFDILSNGINNTVERLKGLIAEAEERIEIEMQAAKTIQYSVLPSKFPPYPERKEFDIYATMDAAKEVGGDFYDFYFVGENKLAFLIADVSGKGIPAAMFMMNAKSVIKDLAESGLSVSELLTKANEKFCETNDADMFVTVWMGILDLSTGLVKYTSAGHNPPLVRHTDGSFEYFKSRQGFVLAGMDGTRYRENELQLAPGDEIFLYTDGVTEAVDENRTFFGDGRLKDVLNSQHFYTSQDVCAAVKQALTDFVGNASQFDDITMLSLKYLGNPDKDYSITVPAEIKYMAQIKKNIMDILNKAGCPVSTARQLNMVIDEIFNNIANYAYPEKDGSVTLKTQIEDSVMTLTFEDSGIPFNPLDVNAPDLTLSLEERPIGGLGITMVKKVIDSISYEYKAGKNILIMKKAIK